MYSKLSRAIRDNVQEMSKGLAELQIAQQRKLDCSILQCIKNHRANVP
jgi:hypothetical protein